MHLGITAYHIRRVSVVGAGLAAIVFAIGYVTGRSHGTVTTPAQVGLLVVWAAAIGALLPAAIFVASVLRLETVAFPLVLTFRDGSRMRLLGAPLGEVRSFAHHIQAQAHRPSSVLDCRSSGREQLPNKRLKLAAIR